MVSFIGRSAYTVRIPSNPILGYKVLAICDAGYTLDWLFTSRIEFIANLEKLPELSYRFPTVTPMPRYTLSIHNLYGQCLHHDTITAKVARPVVPLGPTRQSCRNEIGRKRRMGCH